jgi:type II secretory pathway pseudopilin PulG
MLISMSPIITLLTISKAQSSRDENQGFTMIEVLVGIILTLTFVAVSMQSFVVATAFKVRAREISEADKWIKSDLSSIRIDVAAKLDQDATSKEYRPNFAACRASSTTNGYSTRLETAILATGSNTMSRTSEIGNRSYTVTRTLTPVNAAPYNVLTIEYTVTKDIDDQVVTVRQSELIPDVSLTCQSQSS